jgi:Copper transport outer membrane protein, MctB
VIDFRYHLVSIIAIFLALAVGLVVGATTLTGPTETALTKTEHALTHQNAALEKANAALNQQLNADQAFAQGSASRLLTGLLTGHKVVLVVPPGTDAGMVSGVTADLQQAGATVTGRVMLQPSFFDFSGPTETSLNTLARLVSSQAGVTLASSSSSSSTVSGQEAAATVLGPAILTKSPAGVGLPAATSHTILSQFNGYLQVSPTTGSTLPEASLAVVFTPASNSGSSGQAADTTQVLDALATQLHAYSLGTVMAGSLSAIPNNAITSMNGSGPASTVDFADTAIGQIVVAEALAELLRGKAPTAYGVEPGAAPSPAPTPSATPTPTSTPTTKGKIK